MKQINDETASLLTLIEREHAAITGQLTQLGRLESGVNSQLTLIKDKNRQHDGTVQKIEMEMLSLKREMHRLVTRRGQIASSVNVSVLDGISIDLKLSKAHDIFKWCLAFLYRENLYNYFFYNFKSEAFSDPEDFKERLALILPFNLSSEILLMTQALVSSKDKLLESLEYQTEFQREEIARLFGVAEIVLELQDREKMLAEIKEKQAQFNGSIAYDLATQERLQNEHNSVKNMIVIHERSKAELVKVAEELVFMRECRRVADGSTPAPAVWEAVGMSGCKNRAQKAMS